MPGPTCLVGGGADGEVGGGGGVGDDDDGDDDAAEDRPKWPSMMDALSANAGSPQPALPSWGRRTGCGPLRRTTTAAVPRGLKKRSVVESEPPLAALPPVALAADADMGCMLNCGEAQRGTTGGVCVKISALDNQCARS